MTIKGVFFDLFGTLFIYGDTQAAWDRWIDSLYAGLGEHGLSISKDSFIGHCDAFFGKAEPPAAEDGLTVYERRLNALCDKFEITMDARALGNLADDSAAAWQKHIKQDPQAAEVLEKLKQKTKRISLKLYACFTA